MYYPKKFPLIIYKCSIDIKPQAMKTTIFMNEIKLRHIYTSVLH